MNMRQQLAQVTFQTLVESLLGLTYQLTEDIYWLEFQRKREEIVIIFESLIWDLIKQVMKRILFMKRVLQRGRGMKSVAKGDGDKECCRGEGGGWVWMIRVRALSRRHFCVFFFNKFTSHVLRVLVFHTSHGLRRLCVEKPHWNRQLHTNVFCLFITSPSATLNAKAAPSLLSLDLEFYKTRPGQNSYSKQNYYDVQYKPGYKIEKTEATH